MALLIVIHLIAVEHDRGGDLAHVLICEIRSVAVALDLTTEDLERNHV